MKFRNINSIFFLILFAACNINSNLTKQKAAEVYVNLQIAEERYRHSTDSLKMEQKEIFNRYNTSKDDYEKYLSDFQDDEKQWNEFFDMALKYLNDLKKQETK